MIIFSQESTQGGHAGEEVLARYFQRGKGGPGKDQTKWPKTGGPTKKSSDALKPGSSSTQDKTKAGEQKSGTIKSKKASQKIMDKRIPLFNDVCSNVVQLCADNATTPTQFTRRSALNPK